MGRIIINHTPATAAKAAETKGTIITRKDIAQADADLRAALKLCKDAFSADPLSAATDDALAQLERATTIFKWTLKAYNAQQQYNNTKTN